MKKVLKKAVVVLAKTATWVESLHLTRGETGGWSWRRSPCLP